MVISFLGVRTDGRTVTDRHGFGILIWKHVSTQKISTQSSKLVVSCRSLYASPGGRGCIISINFHEKIFFIRSNDREKYSILIRIGASLEGICPLQDHGCQQEQLGFGSN